jgi:hypothetical protein
MKMEKVSSKTNGSMDSIHLLRSRKASSHESPKKSEKYERVRFNVPVSPIQYPLNAPPLPESQNNRSPTLSPNPRSKKLNTALTFTYEAKRPIEK